MGRLRLNAGDLAVESFPTHARDKARRGTVHAHGATPAILCDLSTLRTSPTCCPCTPMM
jgi:hypothetical protein